MTSKPDDNPANILDQMRKLSRDFGKQLSQGKSPRIQSYLKRIPEEGRENLFRDLLATEINFRQRKGESPSSDEYVKRFPQFKKQVRRAFFEPTMGSVDSGASTDGDDQTASLRSQGRDTDGLEPTFELPDANRLGDYELIRKLGQGGMGIVYEASHTKTNNRVALKTLLTGGDGQQINADKLYRFRKEFRRLSEINHPNLVGMQSLEVDGDRWFFTMDLIDGEDFLSFVRPDDQLDEDRLYSCLKQLATGVMELHRRGIIHRDLKPSNVLVSPEGHVTILDFGLAAQLHRSADMTQTKSGMFAGTPPYAAPEQLFGERTEASDWYAFGTMLFEALTGVRPFQDPDPMKLLRMKHEQDPPQLADRNGMPGDLSVLADGLLRREPGFRLLSDAIGAALGLKEETRIPDSTRDSHGSSGSVNDELSDPVFLPDENIVLIGRDQQLAQLEAAKLELLEKRVPLFVWVSGKSGEGKSTLVESFLRPLHRGKEVLVLKGRCYDRESVPFKAIDCFIGDLCSFLRSPAGQAFAYQLPEDIALLPRVFPELRRVKEIALAKLPEYVNPEAEKVRERAFDALRSLLTSIGKAYPIALFIDDLQWGDADSARILHQLLVSNAAPLVMFIGSFRSDEVTDSHFLKEWQKQATGSGPDYRSIEINVAALKPDQCLQFAVQKLGLSENHANELLVDLIRDSGGNPYFFEQLMEGFDPETNSFKGLSLVEIVEERLTRLPDAAKSLLNGIAVAGQPSPANEIAKVVGLFNEPLAILNHMRNEKLIRFVEANDAYTIETYHDKIRETVLDRLTVQERKDLHLASAKVMLAEDQVELIPKDEEVLHRIKAHPRIHDLAYHFHQADDTDAFYYQLAAGMATLDGLAMEESCDYLQTALEICPTNIIDSARYQLDFNFATALFGTGNIEQSCEHFALALAKADSDIKRAACFSGRAHAFLKQGNMVQAGNDFRDMLQTLGEPEPRTGFGMLFGIFSKLIQLFAVPKWLLSRFGNHRKTDEKQRQTFFASNSTSINFAFLTDSLAFYNRIFSILRKAKLSRDPSIRLSGNSLGAMLIANGGVKIWAKQLLSKAIKDLSLCQSELQVATAKSQLGQAFYYLGDFDNLQTYLSESYEVLEKNRDYMIYAHFHQLRHMYSIRGNACQILYCASRELSHARQTEDNVVCAYASYGLADGLGRIGKSVDAIYFAKEASKRLKDSKNVLFTVPEQELTRALIQNSDYAKATHVAQNNAVQIRRVLNWCELNSDTYPLLVEAELGPNWFQPAEVADRVKRRSIWDARWARFFCCKFPTLRPHALRVSGRAKAATGKTRQAIKYFGQAIAAAEEIGADYEKARSLIDRSMLGGANSDIERQEGIELIERLGCVLPKAECEYLGLDHAGHDARATEAREKERLEHDYPEFELEKVVEMIAQSSFEPT